MKVSGLVGTYEPELGHLTEQLIVLNRTERLLGLVRALGLEVRHAEENLRLGRTLYATLRDAPLKRRNGIGRVAVGEIGVAEFDIRLAGFLLRVFLVLQWECLAVGLGVLLRALQQSVILLRRRRILLENFARESSLEHRLRFAWITELNGELRHVGEFLHRIQGVGFIFQPQKVLRNPVRLILAGQRQEAAPVFLLREVSRK